MASGDASEPDRLEAKLDLLIALLRIAHREPIDAERQRVLEDPVMRTLLGAASRNWTSPSALKQRALKAASKPTVERRLAELVEIGALERRGAGPATEYRSTALFEIS